MRQGLLPSLFSVTCSNFDMNISSMQYHWLIIINVIIIIFAIITLAVR